MTSEIETWLTERVAEGIRRYDIPGAAWAVLADGRIVDGAAGVLSRSTQVEATADSVFQIGSITKLWTSTLILQLVDEGKLDLDLPVRTYVPEFALGDRSAAARITTRQLLTHSAGFEGDIFTDTGRGDDCLEKFVPLLASVPQLFPPGEHFSYNNAGYCVLGRLVELLRNSPYDVCLRDYLFTPLGLTHAAASPYEAILFRAAVGHVQPEPGAGYQPAPIWTMARSNAPAGSALAMSARDLVLFAKMHLNDGRAEDGTRVLGAGTAATMHEQRIRVPDIGLMGNAWGLGFELFETPDGPIVGHDGTTIGQAAFLRMVPGTGVAVALLTNGGDSVSLYREVVEHVLDELTDVHLPPLPAPPAEPPRVDVSRFLGTYSADVLDMVVSQDETGRIWLDETPKGVFADLGGQPGRTELVPYRSDALIPVEADRGMYLPHVFLGDDGDGHSLYLHVGRAFRRAGA